MPPKSCIYMLFFLPSENLLLRDCFNLFVLLYQIDRKMKRVYLLNSVNTRITVLPVMPHPGNFTKREQRISLKISNFFISEVPMIYPLLLLLYLQSSEYAHMAGFQTDIYIIFIFQTIFQNIKLKDTYNTDNNFFHTCIKLLKDLNSTSCAI